MNPTKTLPTQVDRTFKGLRQFNTPDGRRLSNRRDRMNPGWAKWFPTDSLVDRLGRALCRHYAVDMKEFCESFEFFTRVRKHIRAKIVTDLCCGHGFTGLLFAVFEREVERVDLVDRMCPPTFHKLLKAIDEVAPWALSKVEFHTMALGQYNIHEGSSIIGVHACGIQTDRCIESAIELNTPVAVMPCCHSSIAYGQRPRMFDETIGIPLAIDIDRSYRLRDCGYDVRWKAIPTVVTPKNRIILGEPRK